MKIETYLVLERRAEIEVNEKFRRLNNPTKMTEKEYRELTDELKEIICNIPQPCYDEEYSAFGAYDIEKSKWILDEE